MKIITDENIEIEIVIALREAGYDVTDIKEVYPGIDDSAVLSLARETEAVLLTNDKDFGDLVYRLKERSNGVILLRFGRMEMSERIDILSDVLIERENDLAGAFTVISPTGIRIRK